MGADAVSVVEAAYNVEASDEAWIKRICEASWAAFGLGAGCFAYTYDASASRVAFDFPVTAGALAGTAGLGIAEGLRLANMSLPEASLAQLYDESPATTLASERVAPGSAAFRASLGLLQACFGEAFTDVLGVRAGGPDRRGVLLAFPLTGPASRVTPQTRRALDRVAVHVAASYRLRCARRDENSVATAAAVLTANGRVEHLADDDARKSRGALVDAVQRMQHARGTTRRLDPEASLAEWRGLVQGKWSVIDFVDRDGKRLILARRNELLGRDLLAITDVERQVLALASLGHANKHIAYELGLAPSTVTTHLKRGLQRLGFKRRAELIALRASRALAADGV